MRFPLRNAPLTPSLFPLYKHLATQARAARTLAELAFSATNDSYAALPFRQALALREDAGGFALLSVSGLGRPVEDSPYLLWLRRLWPWLRERLPENGGCFTLKAKHRLPADLAEGWAEWWPETVFALPLKRRNGEALAQLLFLLDAPPAPEIEALFAALGEVWAYSWEMLAGEPRPRFWAWRSMSRTRRTLILAGLAIFLLFPVRQSALAPAEIVALDAEIVAAPLDGVLKTIHVRPNQPVKRGEPLFSLDDTTLRNRLEVATKSVRVAEAELLGKR